MYGLMSDGCCCCVMNLTQPTFASLDAACLAYLPRDGVPGEVVGVGGSETRCGHGQGSGESARFTLPDCQLPDFSKRSAM
jgi:hypothetical protein